MGPEKGSALNKHAQDEDIPKLSLRERRKKAEQDLRKWYNRRTHPVRGNVPRQYRMDNPNTTHSEADIEYAQRKLISRGVLEKRLGGWQSTQKSSRQKPRQRVIRHPVTGSQLS